MNTTRQRAALKQQKRRWANRLVRLRRARLERIYGGADMVACADCGIQRRCHSPYKPWEDPIQGLISRLEELAR